MKQQFPEATTYVGAAVKRKEDPRFITGAGSYVDDLAPRGVAYAAVLRSIYAHAILEHIDTTAARAHPGVIAVYTGAEIAPLARPLPERHDPPGIVPIDTAPLATDRVRYVGEPIAIVVADDPYTARDALDLIVVDYTPLEAVVDLEAAIRPGAPQIHDSAPNNIAFHWTHRHGDPDAAFAEAEVVITQRMNNQRLSGVSIEPRAILAEPDQRSGGVIVITSTQTPHWVRSQLAVALDLPESAIRVIAPDVGGGFGVKIRAYPEEALVAALAIDLDRPIKWIETRSEHLATTHHGRGQLAEVTIAARRDGTITALRLHCLADLGSHTRSAGVPVLTGQLMNGVYRFEHIDLDIKGVYTNTMATGAYRGAGRPEASYYLERIIDILAAELELDPIEVRRRNFIPADAFPYQTAAGPIYDSGDYDRALDTLLEMVDYQALRAEQARLRAEGRYLGIGLATFTEVCGLGSQESAQVRIEPDGTVTVATGISPHGQGQETAFAQLAADALGVPLEQVTVVHGDTGRTPAGHGTYGSRGLSVGGSALLRALEVVREKVVQVAAHLLESAPGDITQDAGRFIVVGSPERYVTLAQIATAVYRAEVPAELSLGLDAVEFFRAPNHDFPFGAHLAVVEVDPSSGMVTLQRYVGVNDCGHVVNPLLVDGQIHGGLAQGIAQALWEEIVYDDTGQLLSGSLLDYAVPRASAFPAFELTRTETPTPVNPLGAKGIGELATIGSTPAVANAVLDALRPFGIRHLDLPLRPERIWRAIQAGEGA